MLKRWDGHGRAKPEHSEHRAQSERAREPESTDGWGVGVLLWPEKTPREKWPTRLHENPRDSMRTHETP
jgi:hypothetical protein